MACGSPIAHLGPCEVSFAINQNDGQECPSYSWRVRTDEASIRRFPFLRALLEAELFCLPRFDSVSPATFADMWSRFGDIRQKLGAHQQTE